jgi:uncharacterized protein
MKLACLAFLLFAAIAQADALVDDPAVKVQPVIPMPVHAFDLRDVRLLDGPFKHAMDLDSAYLLMLDTDRLLRNFRVNAGIPTDAKPLGGWEAPDCELRGHFVGHYLSACSQMYASTGDERFKDRTATIVAALAECQEKLGGGYLSAFPETFFDRLEARKNVWAPYYTLHKILAGLLDTYVYTGNPQALDVCRKFADWVITRNSDLTDAQLQRVLQTEQGGMNEVLANLYAITGQERYLRISMRFNHMAVIGPASRQHDSLNGLHANTQIPKFIGAAREYELTGQDWLKTASIFFWQTVVNERSYVIGGDSNGEMFSPKDKLSLALGSRSTETCNTYNMLKLTRHLFCWDPQARYADYYERALYNHILASQDPKTGMMCYYVPLKSGAVKEYSQPYDSFWCCTGTGVENHSKYGDSIYFHGKSDLYVNLFIASQLRWKQPGLTLRQETRFPDEGSTHLIFTPDAPAQFTLHVRHPAWATEGFEIRVNGEKQNLSSQPGSYAVIERTWNPGDTVDVTMPFSTHVEAFADNPRRFAVLNGPLVLSAQVPSARTLPTVTVSPQQMATALEPVAGRPSTFTASAQTIQFPGQLTLEPFYQMQGNRRYVVYFDAVQ